MGIKRTGQEVGAPPDHRVELLPDDFKEYRRRYARGVYASYDAMWENVALFGTPEDVAERIAWLRHSGVEHLISSSTMAALRIARCWTRSSCLPHK